MKDIIKIGFSNYITWVFVTSRQLTDLEMVELMDIVYNPKFSDFTHSYMYDEIMNYLTNLGVCILDDYTVTALFRMF